MFFSCKKADSQILKEKAETRTLIKSEEKVKNNWTFFKIVSLSPTSDYSCDGNQYKSLKIDFINDSVFINNNYTDDVYSTSILSEEYFEHKYLYNAYKKRLKQEFNIDLPSKIKTIRNKKAYEKDSELDKYFQDAFFIKNYMFFENNGCVVCFTQKDETSITNSSSEKLVTKLIYDKKIDINNVIYEEIEAKKLFGADEFSCGEENVRYISLAKKGTINLILIPQDCGDFPYRYYLFTILNNKIISNLYVEGEWFEPENEKATKEITSFTLDSDFIISVITNGVVKKYKIDSKGKIIAI